MTKKALLILAITVMQCNSAIAQLYREAPQEKPLLTPTLDVNRLRFGVFIAPNISWMHPTASKSDDGKYFVEQKGARIGYTWGLMAEYMFTQNYGFLTGFDINKTGGRIATDLNTGHTSSTTPNTVLNSDFNYNLQFLDLPAAFKLKSDRLGKAGIKVTGQLGITLGINVSRKVSYNVAYNDATATQHTIGGDNEKLIGTLAVPPVMMQMNIGIGVEYPLASKIALYTSLFYNNTFLPDMTNPENYEMGYSGKFSDGSVRLNDFGLRIGMFF